MAPRAAGWSAISVECSVCTPSVSRSSRSPRAGSNCQSGRSISGTLPAACKRCRNRPSSARCGLTMPSATSSSAGPIRSSSASTSALADLRDAAIAARRDDRREQDPLRLRCARQHRQRDQRPILPLRQQLRIGEGAGRDRPDHLALDRPLGSRRIPDLLADRDRLAERHQLAEVEVERMHRHAGHRDRFAGRRTALGQRDRQQRRRALRVVVEELVEVAHAVEEQGVRMLRLDPQVLLHHRRMAGEIRADLVSFEHPGSL